MTHCLPIPTAVLLKESGNPEDEKALERSGGPIRSVSDVEAAARVKDSCQDSEGARFSLPVLDPLLSLGLSSAG